MIHFIGTICLCRFVSLVPFVCVDSLHWYRIRVESICTSNLHVLEMNKYVLQSTSDPANQSYEGLWSGDPGCNQKTSDCPVSITYSITHLCNPITHDRLHMTDYTTDYTTDSGVCNTLRMLSFRLHKTMLCNLV